MRDQEILDIVVFDRSPGACKYKRQWVRGLLTLEELVFLVMANRQNRGLHAK